MNESSRRGFLITAGAGAAVAAAAVTVGVTTSGDTPEAAAAAQLPEGASGALAVYVRDVKSAEVAVMAGETEVIVRDPDLVARLATVAATKKG